MWRTMITFERTFLLIIRGICAVFGRRLIPSAYWAPIRSSFLITYVQTGSSGNSLFRCLKCFYEYWLYVFEDFTYWWFYFALSVLLFSYNSKSVKIIHLSLSWMYTWSHQPLLWHSLCELMQQSAVEGGRGRGERGRGEGSQGKQWENNTGFPQASHE